MKFFNKLTVGAVTAVFALSTALAFGLGGVASADCFQYDPNGFLTSHTPVFNNICGVPEGIGNESDFVRIRQSSNGNDQDNQNNPNFQDALTVACKSGDKFDLWNYVHNDADSNDNNNGTGSAIAHDVQLALHAGLGTTSDHFTFGATVSASNAQSVSDTATLNCGGKQVKLSIVPSSVHLYSSQYGWKDLSDSAVDGSTKIGSPSAGSGDVWGCWNYRVLVVYEVQVQELPPQPKPPVLQCLINEGDFTFDNETRKVSLKVTAQVQNATVTGYKIDWGDHTTANTQSASHTYASDIEKATITASFTVKEQEQPVSGPNCVENVVFTKTPTPPVTPPQTPPTVLPNTGAGSLAGIFGAATLAGIAGFRFFAARRLSRD